jgi:hypothetical protein
MISLSETKTTFTADEIAPLCGKNRKQVVDLLHNHNHKPIIAGTRGRKGQPAFYSKDQVKWVLKYLKIETVEEIAKRLANSSTPNNAITPNMAVNFGQTSAKKLPPLMSSYDVYHKYCTNTTAQKTALGKHENKDIVAMTNFLNERNGWHLVNGKQPYKTKDGKDTYIVTAPIEVWIAFGYSF